MTANIIVAVPLFGLALWFLLGSAHVMFSDGPVPLSMLTSACTAISAALGVWLVWG